MVPSRCFSRATRCSFSLAQENSNFLGKNLGRFLCPADPRLRRLARWTASGGSRFGKKNCWDVANRESTLIRWIAFGFCVGLIACGPPSLPVETWPEQDPAALIPCGAHRLGNLVGLGLEDLMRIEILGPVRVIRPSDAVTEDFFPARLNIYLTSSDTVARLTCG
ncbi:MAG: I78 family peptidase inhibitor [Pseudomonadota bacterium]